MAVGDSASFTVAATGDALTYQWRQGGLNLNSADTAKYTGVTEATLEVMNAVDVDDEGAYSVVISNAAGDVTSDGTAILTIRKYKFAEYIKTACTCIHACMQSILNNLVDNYR